MKIYKITEASEYLGVSINTLKTLANNNKINSFKTSGKHRRFKMAIPPWFIKDKDRKGKFYVYILRCCNDKYYVGETEHLINRLYAHISGGGAKFIKRHPPCELVHLEFYNTYSEACFIEILLRKMVNDGWLDFKLPDEYGELFYRIIAFASPADPLSSPIQVKQIEEDCRDFIDLPEFQATRGMA